MQRAGQRSEQRRRPRQPWPSPGSVVGHERAEHRRDREQTERVAPRKEAREQVAHDPKRPVDHAEGAKEQAQHQCCSSRPESGEAAERVIADRIERRAYGNRLPQQQRQPGRHPERRQSARDRDRRLEVIRRSGVQNEQIRCQHVVGGIADPRQILHLVDEVEAVGPRPYASVGNHLPQIEDQNPHRHRPERAQHREVEPVDPAPSARWRNRRRSWRAYRNTGLQELGFDSHRRATLTAL